MRKRTGRHLVLLSLFLISPMLSAEESSELVELLLDRIAQLEERIDILEQSLLADEQAPAIARAVVEQTPADTEIVTAAEERLIASVDFREQEQLVRAAFESTLVDRGGLLLRPWTIDVEPSITYQNSSTDRIIVDGFTILPILVIGDIVSERLQRQQTTAAISARLGLPGDLQLDLNVPYVHEDFQIVTAENEETIESLTGFGDVSVGLSWQAHRSRGVLPDVVAALNWKFDNGKSPFDVGTREIAFGSGYQSLAGRLTAVKVVDPIVYYGGLTYIYGFDTSEDFGKFSPGSSVGFNLGLALALNLTSSINISYDQLITSHSQLSGEEIPGSNSMVGVVSIGGSYAGSSYAIDFSVGLGVTSDSPDVLVRTAIPLRSVWR